MKATYAGVFLAALVEGAVTRRQNLVPRYSNVTAPPSPPPPEGAFFTLHQIENQDFNGHDGAMAFMHAHIKYGDKLPDEISNALDANPKLRAKLKLLGPAYRQKGTVSSLPSPGIDSEYSIVVQMGMPPQSIPLNLDTGSSDLWSMSTDTLPSMVNGQAVYRPANSFTSKRMDGSTWKIKYGDDASADGIVYIDRVQIGETFVEHQAIEAAIHVSQDVSSDKFVSGILGMANSAANTVRPVPQKTYIDNIKSQLALPLFTANLRSKAPGNYNFGYINQSEYIGEIKYMDIDLFTPFWKIASTGYRVGNFEQKFVIDAIVDTGTSLMLLPQNVVMDYWSKVPGAYLDPQQGMMIFPCAQPLPDFELVIKQYYGRVPGSYMNYGKVSDTSCFGGIQSSEGLPFSVLGDVFLKAQFVVFNYESAAVGLANKVLQ